MSFHHSPRRAFVVSLLCLVHASVAITSASDIPSMRNISAVEETRRALEPGVPSEWKAYQDPYWNLRLRYPPDWRITSIPYQGFGVRFSSPDLHVDEQGNVTQGGYFWIDVAPESVLTTETGTIGQGIESLYLAHGYSYRTRFLHVPSPSTLLAVYEAIVQSLDISEPPSQYPPMPFNETDLDAPLKLPLPAGPAFIASGGGYNNGGNHVNVDKYALDFCMPDADDCQNNNYVVIAPTNLTYVHSASGRRDFHFFKVAADIGVQFSLCMSLAHFSLDVPLSKGDSVPRGAALGRLSGYYPPHRHMGIWVAPSYDDDCVGLADGDYLALPFIDQTVASPNGDFRLEGQSYPVCDDDGCDNAHASKPVESTNVPFCYNPLREHVSSPSAPNSRAGADVNPIDCFPPDRAFLPLALSIPPPPSPWVVLFKDSEAVEGHHIIQTRDRNLLVLGRRRVAGNADIWIVKLDSLGQAMWQKTYATAMLDETGGIYETLDGGYIINGGISSTSGSPAWILKLDPSGNIDWQKTFSRGYDFISEIFELSEGGYVMVGGTSPLEGSNTNSDAWIAVLDSGGDLVQQKVMGLDGDFDNYSFGDITATSDGGYVAAGSAGAFGCQLKAWVVKFDRDLNVQWQRSYSGGDCAIANFIQETNDGGYMIAGQTAIFDSGKRVDLSWILKLRQDGEIAWQKAFDTGESYFYQISYYQTVDGGVVATTSYSAEDGLSNGEIMKLNENGDILWQRGYGGPGIDSLSSIVETSEGDYAVTGTTFMGGGRQAQAWMLRVGVDGNIPNCGLDHNVNVRNIVLPFTSSVVNIPVKSTILKAINLQLVPMHSSVGSSFVCEQSQHYSGTFAQEHRSIEQEMCPYQLQPGAEPFGEPRKPDYKRRWNQPQFRSW